MLTKFGFPHKFLRIAFCVCLCVCVFACIGRSSVNAERAGQMTSDRAAVHRILVAYETAWNKHDVRGFAKLFSSTADFTNVRGAASHGRLAIERAHKSLFVHLFQKSHQTVTGISIRFLRPDVAAAEVRWTMIGATNADGTPRPITHGLRALVLTKENGEWQIEIFHNMELLPKAAGVNGKPTNRVKVSQ